MLILPLKVGRGGGGGRFLFHHLLLLLLLESLWPAVHLVSPSPSCQRPPQVRPSHWVVPEAPQEGRHGQQGDAEPEIEMFSVFFPE